MPLGAALRCAPWGCSSAGRAPRSHRGGQGFESPHLHHLPIPGPSYRCPDAPRRRVFGVRGLPALSRRPRMPQGLDQDLVLVAEDDASNRALLSRLLERAGYRSIAVGDGRDAIKAAVDEAPNLVLLDVGLPGLNGLDVCRRLR